MRAHIGATVDSQLCYGPVELHIYCICIMLAGVTAFTFISGALSSILANYDTSQAVLHENLLYLGKLR